MKTAASVRSILLVLVFGLILVGVGCTRDQMASSSGAPRRRIPLAPVGVSSPGIGAPGAGSMDTRGTGTVADGEGDATNIGGGNGSVLANGAANTPGTTTVPGARNGGRL